MDKAIDKYLQLLEARDKKWIQKAVGEPGALHKALDVPKGEKIPSKKLKVKDTDSTRVKKMKTLAKTLKKISAKKKSK